MAVKLTGPRRVLRHVDCMTCNSTAEFEPQDVTVRVVSARSPSGLQQTLKIRAVKCPKCGEFLVTDFSLKEGPLS